MIDKNRLLIYPITDRKIMPDFYSCIESALSGGAEIIQLREKNISDEDLVAEALKVKEICRRYNALLIINDNYNAALKSGADGVHVGIEDTPVAEIRKIAGDNFIIGATAKTVEQAKKAQAEGADYLGTGAVFPSPTKTDAIRITAQQFVEIAESVKIPVVAIGGINRDNITQLKGIGAVGAALVSAAFSADDIEKQTAELKNLCRETFK
ncbi:MAG: thiamine phosphate synthase [Ruminococcus sp.]|nr:thiamine phosphate synthase [Ruminococcus sp.]